MAGTQGARGRRGGEDRGHRGQTQRALSVHGMTWVFPLRCGHERVLGQGVTRCDLAFSRLVLPAGLRNDWPGGEGEKQGDQLGGCWDSSEHN